MNLASAIKDAFGVDHTQPGPARVVTGVPAFEAFGLASLGVNGYTALARQIPFAQQSAGVQAAAAREGWAGEVLTKRLTKERA
jgi:hypothetical protein